MAAEFHFGHSWVIMDEAGHAKLIWRWQLTDCCTIIAPGNNGEVPVGIWLVEANDSRYAPASVSRIPAGDGAARRLVLADVIRGLF